jgi:hypothetical protein
MSILIPIKARIEQARSFFRDVANVNDFFSVFFGRTKKWSTPIEIISNLSDTHAESVTAHQNMIALKRINVTDIVFMIRRIDWTYGEIYERYSDLVDLSDKDFYVYNSSNYCIYKCLNRQDYIDGSSPVPSTDMPSDTTPQNFATADGYWWRLVYFVPAADRLKFLSADYIPVRFYSSSTNFNVSGEVSSVEMDSVGSGYTEAPLVIITGDGKGASAVANVTNGAVDSVRVVTGGFGYTWAEISFESSLGTGASATPTLQEPTQPESLNVEIAAAAQATAGAIDFVDILNINSGGRGENYTPETIFSVIGDGAEATVSVTFVEGGNGNVDTITIGNGGRGYTFASISTIGDGNDALLRPIIAPIHGHGGNVPAELFATTVCISSDVEDFLDDVFIGNNFRQVGIIKNVRGYGVNAPIFGEATADASYTIEVSDAGNYTIDDQISSDGGGLFTVISIDGSIVRLLPLIDDLSETSILTNETTSGSLAAIVGGSLVSPEVNTKTGDIIYLRNMLPVERQTGQTETITLFFNY